LAYNFTGENKNYIIGFVLVAIVIFLGIKTYEQNIVFTILFGLASAFVTLGCKSY